MPADATVGVTVVPSSGRASAAIASTWWAASTSALTPFSGSSPACAARPCTTTSKPPVPLRPIFTRAVGGRFEHEHGAAGRGPLLDQRPRRAGPDLLVGGEQQLDPRPVGERGDGVDAEHDAALHVEHTGAGHPAVGHPERPGGERADRVHRVVMADEQDARLARPAPVHVRARRAVDQLGRVAQPPLDQRGDGAADFDTASRSCDGDSTSTRPRRSSSTSSRRMLVTWSRYCQDPAVLRPALALVLVARRRRAARTTMTTAPRHGRPHRPRADDQSTTPRRHRRRDRRGAARRRPAGRCSRAGSRSPCSTPSPARRSRSSTGRRRRRRGRVDELGSLLFRDVPAGTYTIRSATETTDGVRRRRARRAAPAVVLRRAAPARRRASATCRPATARRCRSTSCCPAPPTPGRTRRSSSTPATSRATPSAASFAQIYTTLGYAYVGVNVRGSGCSGGSFRFFEDAQLLDGYDAIETVAAQPWVLGNRVGMVGVSYPGHQPALRRLDEPAEPRRDHPAVGHRRQRARRDLPRRHPQHRLRRRVDGAADGGDAARGPGVDG